ncbi:amino acid transporter [Leishmania donovani]|uniref:Amino_acid_transporter_-_putative n=3 Tax=Leishmania donovani species complex TaxID=38574 RepID=A0A6L0XIX2_LEIIN|nr:putative amino acid permease [Leishmania infantum JPCM5]TPP46126.1 Transmembrane amino acid transporter family protein [Leishmania donovani]CAC9499060.1 amino_acid_transporter_-_putative [Leishmania infantum]CAJ1989932.1 amino acid transporter [Leishmania donovani]CBZ08816.1 putative amino acid permease [Leishmania infantum JPCM5]SUZ42949.1 amino_acid_transporter_-_putative [Leishmania infantum]|eukprot:XP_003392640.1 putative amino acid permease [Leishmania infantum JPCM5]
MSANRNHNTNRAPYPQRGQGRLASDNMPEDPPEYGEDGLHMLNNDHSQEHLADEVVVGASDADGKTKGSKKLESPSLTDDGEPAAKGNKQQSAYMDIAQQIIEADQRNREDRVWRRRHTTNPVLRALQVIMPYGGILASAFSIASSTIGGGIIGLPAAFQMSGMGMAIIYLIVVVIMAIYSFVLLAIVSHKTGLYNWEIIARRLMGRGWDYFVVFVMWVLCFGGDVSYIIALKSILTGFLKNSPTASEYIKSEPGYRLITSMLWIVVILPMCLPKEINSLRIVSTVAILFVVFFTITCIIHSSQSLHARGMRDDLVSFQTGNTAINGLSSLMFAFIAQVNAPEISREMYKFSVHRVFLSALLGMSLCAILYFLTGLFGYLDFGPEVSDSILAMYNPLKNHLMAVSYVGMMLKICVGFALHLIPCRDCVYYMIGTEVSHVPWWKNAILCSLQAAAALVAGLFIPRITTVFGLLGGFCGGFVGFIFPSLFMMYSGGFSAARIGWGHFLGTYALLLTGVVAVVWGTSAAIHGAVLSSW